MTDTSSQAMSTLSAPHLNELASSYLEAILQGNRERAAELIFDAIGNNTSIRDIYLDVFQPALHEVGRLWENNTISVAVEHFCTAATQMIMSQLYPLLFSGTIESKGLSVAACCVGNELHEVGLRMVCDFFEMHGWDTNFMGSNCSAEAILNNVASCHVLCLSVTMYHNIGKAKKTIEEIKHRFPDIIVLVGGYSISQNPELVQHLGADGTADNAEKAVALAFSLVNNN